MTKARKTVAILTGLLLAQLLGHLCACDNHNASPPDAPAPSCAALGCTLTLCASREGPCTCQGQTCDPAAPIDAGMPR